MYYIKTSASFDSAHFLHGYQGKCSNLHGHHWVIEVLLQSKKLQKDGQQSGMLIDFGDVKKELRSLADCYDHSLIYEQDTLMISTIAALKAEGFNLISVPFRPTAENFAKHFYDHFVNKDFPVKSITVYETPDNCAVYEVDK